MGIEILPDEGEGDGKVALGEAETKNNERVSTLPNHERYENPLSTHLSKTQLGIEQQEQSRNKNMAETKPR